MVLCFVLPRKRAKHISKDVSVLLVYVFSVFLDEIHLEDLFGVYC